MSQAQYAVGQKETVLAPCLSSKKWRWEIRASCLVGMGSLLSSQAGNVSNWFGWWLTSVALLVGVGYYCDKSAAMRGSKVGLGDRSSGRRYLVGGRIGNGCLSGRGCRASAKEKEEGWRDGNLAHIWHAAISRVERMGGVLIRARMTCLWQPSVEP